MPINYSSLADESKKLIIYCLIGVSGVTLDFIVFFILTEKFNIHYQLANAISVSSGITNNFLLNAYLNFKTKDKLFNRFVKFYLVGLLGLLISALLLYLFIDRLSMSLIPSKLVTIFAITIVQYTLNRTITFRRRS